MKIKAIVFDLDGTLADTIPLTVFAMQEAIREYTGKTISEEEILQSFGPVDPESVRKFIDNDRKEQGVETYFGHFSNRFDEFVKPMEGLTDLLEFIKSKNIKLGLFTGRSRRGAHIVLEKLNIAQYFDEIYSGDDVKNPKPDPEGILMALQQFGAAPEESIYAGDVEADIGAAKNAGTLSVLALWSSTGSEKYIELNPDKYFYSPYEFINWLKELDL